LEPISAFQHWLTDTAELMILPACGRASGYQKIVTAGLFLATWGKIGQCMMQDYSNASFERVGEKYHF